MSKIINNFVNNKELLVKDDSIKIQIKKKNQPDEEIIVSKFNKSAGNLINKGIILYGPTESGKSFIIRDFMYIMKSKFPLVFAFVPTNMEKHDYDTIIPKPLVFEEVLLKQIKEIYIRQRTATEIYNNANNLNTLDGLFNRIADIRSKQMIKKLLLLKEKAIKEAELKTETQVEKKNKIEEIENIFKEKIISFYKQIINSNYKKLIRMEDLNNEEKFALAYRNLNPHILIIFDDALTEIMKLLRECKKEEDEVIKNFFFKGRHDKISHWYAFQDDVGLDSAIRKNAHINIFTTKQVATSYFKRQSNGFTRDEIKLAESVIEAVFSPNAPSFSKLVYSRADKNRFFYIVAEEHSDSEVQMCSGLVKQYCDKITTKNNGFDVSNPYFSKFASQVSK